MNHEMSIDDQKLVNLPFFYQRPIPIVVHKEEHNIIYYIILYLKSIIYCIYSQYYTLSQTILLNNILEHTIRFLLTGSYKCLPFPQLT